MYNLHKAVKHNKNMGETDQYHICACSDCNITISIDQLKVFLSSSSDHNFYRKRCLHFRIIEFVCWEQQDLNHAHGAVSYMTCRKMWNKKLLKKLYKDNTIVNLFCTSEHVPALNCKK